MARVGVYGVSIFFVLSGLTMYHVYAQKMTSLRSVVQKENPTSSIGSGRSRAHAPNSEGCRVSPG